MLGGVSIFGWGNIKQHEATRNKMHQEPSYDLHGKICGKSGEDIFPHQSFETDLSGGFHFVGRFSVGTARQRRRVRSDGCENAAVRLVARFDVVFCNSG